jgi:two-component system, NarL family, sensor histidine kinase DevS
LTFAFISHASGKSYQIWLIAQIVHFRYNYPAVRKMVLETRRQLEEKFGGSLSIESMLEELRQRNEDLALINDLAAALACSQDMPDILNLTLNRVIEYLHVEAGEIFLTDEDSHELKLALHVGDAAEAFWTRDRFAPGEGFVGLAAREIKPIISDTLNKDTRFLRPAVIAAGFRCMACVPLTAPGKVVGVLSIATRQKRPLDEREIQLLTAVGTWAGIAIENVRLDQQARRLAVLEERDRIGMDLHDSIIQSIYAVGLGLDFARVAIADDPEQARAKIDQAIEGLNSTIRDWRTYILDLRPRQFRGTNLMDGLRRLIEEFRVNGLQNVTLIGPESDHGVSGLPVEHATALFHITQEALANTAKHARALQTTVQVWTAPGRVLVEIADNGQGFDLRKMSVTIGHGLSNIHTRAHRVGGDVEIISEPGNGISVLAWVPTNSQNDLPDQPQ